MRERKKELGTGALRQAGPAGWAVTPADGQPANMKRSKGGGSFKENQAEPEGTEPQRERPRVPSLKTKEESQRERCREKASGAMKCKL